MFCIVCCYLSPLVCIKSYGVLDREIRIWSEEWHYALLSSVVENLKSNCSWVFWISFATSTKVSSTFGKELGQLFGVHSWTFRGWGSIQLERLKGRGWQPLKMPLYTAYFIGVLPQKVWRICPGIPTIEVQPLSYHPTLQIFLGFQIQEWILVLTLSLHNPWKVRLIIVGQ
jgi:hypothetical protein